MIPASTHKITGLVILVVGALFFLRDLGVNYIGDTKGWTIFIVLLGAGLLAGDFHFSGDGKMIKDDSSKSSTTKLPKTSFSKIGSTKKIGRF